MNEMGKQIHQNIGPVLSKRQNYPNIFFGTGILISPDIVLTVAHNIVDRPGMKARVDIRFYRGQCGILDKYHEVEKFYVPEAYRQNASAANDYALLKLKDRVNADNFIPLSANHNLNKESILTILGYPADYYKPINLAKDNF